MNLKGDKYVRFNDGSSENSFTLDANSNRKFIRLRKPSLSSITDGIRRGLDYASESFNSLKKRWSSHKPSQKITNRPTRSSQPTTTTKKTRILDPQGPFLQRWNKIFMLSCIIAVSLDPLFFYIPVINGAQFCLSLDKNIEITASVLRSLVDLFYIFHIVLQFRTGFISPKTRVFGRGELVEDGKAIAKRYLLSYFIVDVLSILPLPQVVILMVNVVVKGPISHVTKEMLKTVIFVQYIPRIWRIYPLYKEVTATSGIFTETAWAGAALNLFLYMLASNMLGAFWYLFAIERKDSCWREACGNNTGCKMDDLYCVEGRNPTLFLSSACPLLEPNQLNETFSFDFGIALDALRERLAERPDFSRKFLYCFWWGLRNLSSFGQNLKTSTFEGEILFAIGVSVMGLILFSLLIGNMQKYLESITTRVEEMRVKRRDAEHWMSHRMLPDDLKARIRRYEQYKWQENRGVEEESLIRNFPHDLRRDVKRHLCWSLLTRVPMFDKMDEQLLDALCSRLKPVLYTADSIIVREGDPVVEMLFIMRGNILTTTTNGGRTGFFNEVRLMEGAFCGEELLTWALDPNSSSSLPISTRTVKAVKDVEAFCLMPEDLKSVASQQFRRLNSKQLQQTFRFYSQQWKTWGACFIQAAWRRYCRRKIERELKEAEEGRLQGAILHAPSIAAAVYASRFARNMLGNLRRGDRISNLASPKLPTLLPQKPSEPDFSEGDRSFGEGQR